MRKDMDGNTLSSPIVKSHVFNRNNGGNKGGINTKIRQKHNCISPGIPSQQSAAKIKAGSPLRNRNYLISLLLSFHLVPWMWEQQSLSQRFKGEDILLCHKIVSLALGKRCPEVKRSKSEGVCKSKLPALHAESTERQAKVGPQR